MIKGIQIDINHIIHNNVVSKSDEQQNIKQLQNYPKIIQHKTIPVNNSKKPLSVLRSEIVAERQRLLIPIQSKEEYDEVLKEILEYKISSSESTVKIPYIYIWDYDHINPELKGLVAYCGADDKSASINAWLTGRPIPNDKYINSLEISQIIRALDYSLIKLDERYGKYKGIVYRKGFFNPNTDKQFYSASTNSMGAVKHNSNNLPAKDNPYSIIKVKNGHNIYKFQKDTNSFLSRQFANTEKEILIDRKSNFRIVPEKEYTENDKKLKSILLAQAMYKTNEITDRDIQVALYQHSDLLKYINIWEEI